MRIHLVAVLPLVYLLGGCELDGGPVKSGPVGPGTVDDPDTDTDADTDAGTDTAVEPIENTAPSIVLETPEDGPIPYAGVPFGWRAWVEDAEDPAADLVLTWQSDLAGALTELPVSPDVGGLAEGSLGLAEGTHAVTVTVRDTEGLEASVVVNLVVGAENSSPTCALTAPDDGAVLELGDDVDVLGTADDAEQPAETLAARLESDIGGLLFDGAPTVGGLVAVEGLALAQGDHTLRLVVTDELGLTCTDTRTLRIGRSPVVAIAAPVDGDIINEGEIVDLIGTIVDPDTAHGDLAAAWSSDRDGALVTGTVDASGATTASWGGAAAGAHTLTLTGTDPDGFVGTDAIALTINQAPTAPTVRIDPDPAITTDDLVATVTGSVDPDGVGTLAYIHAWTQDGVPWSGGSLATVPAAATAKHETWTVTVTPTDGYASGPTGSDSITVDNADPLLGTPSVSPAADLGVGETATCIATASDPDGDSVSLSYVWADASGSVLGTGSTYTLPAATIAPGGSVVCVVTADDGDGGTATASVNLSIANSDPTVLSVEITPGSGVYAGDTLICTAVSSDPDGDSLTTTYSWQNTTTATAPMSGSSYTVVAGSDSPGDTLQCTATVEDGRGGTDSGTDTVDIDNSDPIVTSVGITPSAPFNDSTVGCSATATDADGGRPSISFVWSGPGGTIATGATTTLTSADIMPTEGLTCEATATDMDGGTGTGSSTAIVSNRLPAVTGVSVSPDPGHRGDTLSCTVTGASDADDDPVSIGYQWWNGTTMITSGSDTWVATEPAGTTITCRVVPSDGHGSGTAVSDLLQLQNAAPTITSLSLTPSAPDTDDTVTALVSAVDVDGDPIYYNYAWAVSGSTVSGATGTSLDGVTAFGKGDTVAVTVTPRGPTTTGTAVTSVALTVVNTPPLAPTIEVTPDTAALGDDLLCTVTAPAYDVDADSISYTAVWTDASGATAATSGATVFSGDTLPASVTSMGDTWTCTVTPNDGDDDGPTGADTATVGCDEDGDGALALACGGGDCDDADATRRPGIGDTYGDGVDSDCDGLDCEADDDGGSYFSVCPDETGSWSVAESACLAVSYDGLASLETAAEMSFVEDLMIASGVDATASPWIGLYESGGEGTWIWASGSSVVVTDWAASQPDDDASGGEDCAHLNWPLGGLQWNDVACDGVSSAATVIGFVCEREL